ncbi:MAG: hypothetical protein MJ217_02690 [Bacilli bacterium]|nr:hypothetical protein [Bacilli bacterium]
MKILSLLSFPIILGTQAIPSASFVENENAEKLLILKDGSKDLTGKIDTAGIDENP